MHPNLHTCLSMKLAGFWHALGGGFLLGEVGISK